MDTTAATKNSSRGKKLYTTSGEYKGLCVVVIEFVSIVVILVLSVYWENLERQVSGERTPFNFKPREIKYKWAERDFWAAKSKMVAEWAWFYLHTESIKYPVTGAESSSRTQEPEEGKHRQTWATKRTEEILKELGTGTAWTVLYPDLALGN